MLLCLSSREFREVLLVAFGKVAVVYEASFDTDAARLSAVKARTVAINQIKRLLVTAPEQVAAFLRGLRTAAALVGACARLRPDPDRGEAPAAAKRSLRVLAGRWRALGAEISELDAEIARPCERAAPPCCPRPLNGDPQPPRSTRFRAGSQYPPRACAIVIDSA